MIQKDHINKAHDIVNICFKDELENSGHAFMARYMQPHMNKIMQE